MSSYALVRLLLNQLARQGNISKESTFDGDKLILIFDEKELIISVDKDSKLQIELVGGK